ncbi:hypothetical protein KBC70_04570 [Candidatus Woesebacteria bacterium]|jgi:hypothetical protein|nr:hypothetical protein [Candidatus Woesebacteria bacterium]
MRTEKSVPKEPLSFKAAADEFTYGPFLFGLWATSFLMYGFSMSPFKITHNSLAVIGATTFFLNAIYYLARENGHQDDEIINNLFFGAVAFFVVNAALGQMSWMNYSPQTMLLEFIFITVTGFLLITVRRYAK